MSSIGDPPSKSGAVHDTVTCSEAVRLASTDDGGSGTVNGVAGSDVAASLSPSSFSATTVKVYSVPLSRPPIVHDNGSTSVGTVEQVAPSGLAVTV